MIDETLYKPAINKYCSFCGSLMSTELVDSDDEAYFNPSTGERALVWEYTCPNKTNKWFDKHTKEKSRYAWVEKKDAKPKVLFDITIYYRVRGGMEQQKITDTTDSGGYTSNSSGMMVFSDSVNDKFIQFNTVDILRVDTVEKKQN